MPPVASKSSITRARSPLRHAVDVDLDTIRAVLEIVVVAIELARQLARLADRHEPRVDLVRERGAEDEAARLDADDLVDLAAIALGEQIDHVAKPDARSRAAA